MEELSKHDSIIKRFVETDECHYWFAKKFRKPPKGFSLRGFIAVLQLDDPDAEHPTFVPDAWSIDFTTHTVWLLEVVHWNKMDSYKLAQILNLFWALDYYTFRLAMVVHDVTMDFTREVPFEQMSLWALRGGHGEPWNAVPDPEPASTVTQ